MSNLSEKKGLSGNGLKIIALITMTMDHVGLELLPGLPILRIFGRLAFPIFAYMVGEGCRHTHDRGKYLRNMALFALLCQSVYFFAEGSLYMSVLVSFTLGIGAVCILDRAREQSAVLPRLAFPAAILSIYWLCEELPLLLPHTDYCIDYGFFGCMIPVCVSIGKTRLSRLLLCAACLILMCLSFGGIQWFSLLSLPLLMLYNGTRGKRKLKNLFYIYYPAHLVIIEGIRLLLTR